MLECSRAPYTKRRFVDAMGIGTQGETDVNYDADVDDEVNMTETHRKFAKVCDNDSGEKMMIPTNAFKDTVFTFVFMCLKLVYDESSSSGVNFEDNKVLEVVSDAACMCFHVVNSVCGEDGDTFFTDHVFWEDGVGSALIAHSLKLVVCSLCIATKLYVGCDDASVLYDVFLLSDIAMRVTEKCESKIKIPNQVIRDLRSRLQQLTKKDLAEFEWKVFSWNCSATQYSHETENTFRNNFILFLEDRVES